MFINFGASCRNGRDGKRVTITYIQLVGDMLSRLVNHR